MIIAAYAGCGKTTFANRIWSSTDLVCVPYKYDVKSEPCSEDTERNKANYGYDMNPNWPRNYVSAVITAYHRYRYVVIPTIMPVLLELQRFRIPYIICYPERALKEEYRQRFRERGNTAEFERIFVDGWDDYIDMFETDEYGKHIKLSSGEFLLDRKSEIESFAKATECIQPLYTDDSVEEDIQRIFEETGVCIEEQMRQFFMYVAEHDDLAEKWKEEGMMSLDGYEMMKITI